MKLYTLNSNIIFLEKGILSLQYLDTDHHWADTVTKPLAKIDSSVIRKSKHGHPEYSNFQCEICQNQNVCDFILNIQTFNLCSLSKILNNDNYSLRNYLDQKIPSSEVIQIR